MILVQLASSLVLCLKNADERSSKRAEHLASHSALGILPSLQQSLNVPSVVLLVILVISGLVLACDYAVSIFVPPTYRDNRFMLLVSLWYHQSCLVSQLIYHMHNHFLYYSLTV
jgi:hypothetical protein